MVKCLGCLQPLLSLECLPNTQMNNHKQSMQSGQCLEPCVPLLNFATSNNHDDNSNQCLRMLSPDILSPLCPKGKLDETLEAPRLLQGYTPGKTDHSVGEANMAGDTSLSSLSPPLRHLRHSAKTGSPITGTHSTYTYTSVT